MITIKAMNMTDAEINRALTGRTYHRQMACGGYLTEGVIGKAWTQKDEYGGRMLVIELEADGMTPRYYVAHGYWEDLLDNGATEPYDSSDIKYWLD